MKTNLHANEEMLPEKLSVAHPDGQGQDFQSSKISRSMYLEARAKSTECAWWKNSANHLCLRLTHLMASSLSKNPKFAFQV